MRGPAANPSGADLLVGDLAVGAWRERQNGEGRQGGPRDPLIDASGILPSGQAFKTLPEFKRILLDEKAKFLKGFTEKLLAYALGRPVGATDQELVKGILSGTARQEHRLQAMIQAKLEGQQIVATPAPHIAPVIDIMEALKKSLAEQKKPVASATAAVAEAEAEDASEQPSGKKRSGEKSPARGESYSRK